MKAMELTVSQGCCCKIAIELKTPCGQGGLSEIAGNHQHRSPVLSFACRR